MSRRPVAAIAFAAVVVAIVLRASAGTDARQVVTHPYAGVTYVDRTEAQPRALRMHIVQVDLDVPGIRLKLSPPSGTREVVRQTTLEFLEQEGAAVAINAHFFWPFPSPDRDVEVLGIAASEGRVYSGFESPAQNYALVADAPGFNIDRGNRAQLVHRSSATADRTTVLEPVALWTAVSGSAQIVTNGQVSVPAYKDESHPDAPLTPGGPAQYSNQKSWYDAINARTAIGLARDSRTLTLFTVDARGGSLGMNLREVATVLISDYGVWQALNLDGGGSTTLAMRDPRTHVASIINTSSDNPVGRAVGSSLAVFAGERGQ